MCFMKEAKAKKFTPRVGKWYGSKEEVRNSFGEFWKGILIRDNRIGIIFNFVGARRIHYGDKLDYNKGEIFYIGEGKKGNQTLNSRNQVLVNAVKNNNKIEVYLDCGDIFKPKKILYAGHWNVIKHKYITVDNRKVYQFKLVPSKNEIIDFLHFTFNTSGTDKLFEKDLDKFAKARTVLYKTHAGIMRSRDNIIGEIGEYFAIKEFNRQAENQLVRLTSAFKDIDAISIKSGKRYAIKTIGSFPSATSNIWSENIIASVDYFLICHLDPMMLKPRFICILSSKKAAAFLRKDNYQGSYKLKIDDGFLKISKILFDNRD
jgi:hypothetical protein